jgi:hypothetical protein
LVRRVHKTAEGFSGLSHAEQIYFAVAVFDGEVYNGGVHQFFSNSSGGYYATVLAGLTELGAGTTRTLLLHARDVLFPDSEPPADWEARRQVLPWWPKDESAPTPAWSMEIERINKQLWAKPDNLDARLSDFAKRHHLIPDADTSR